MLLCSLIQREKKYISGQKRPVSPQKNTNYLYFNALHCVKISFLPFSRQPTTPRPVAPTIANCKSAGICEIRPVREASGNRTISLLYKDNATKGRKRALSARIEGNIWQHISALALLPYAILLPYVYRGNTPYSFMFVILFFGKT